MRLLFVIGLIVGALSVSAKIYGSSSDVAGMISTLNQEFGGSFFADNNDPSKIKLKSESGNRIIWWYVTPEKAFEADEVSLFKVRVDNLGQGNAVYHLLVGEQPYKLHLSEETACLKANPTTPEAHVALIKSWVATFKGQLISNALVVRSE